MRKVVQSIAGPVLFALTFLAIESGAQPVRADDGLTGDVRKTFTEASTRSCLKTQIDAPANQAIPVAMLFDYCKCYSNGMADKISNDEVKALEATGSEEKYQAALRTRLEASARTCIEALRSSLKNPN